jgi:aminoglycoside 3-N-acetyltransferase
MHSSLSSLGWVEGGARTVVLALLAVLGRKGTLVVPSQTAYNRDPHRLAGPPPDDLIPVIREQLPAFDPETTPSRRMGRIAECVRRWPGALRSAHPQTSFAAVGENARYVVEPHLLENQLDEHSPLGRLAECNARILLLGVGFKRCTAFHLAEYRLPGARWRRHQCVLQTERGRAWVTYVGRILDETDFQLLGDDLERSTDLVTYGRVGSAQCRLVLLPAAVKFAESWFRQNRTGQPVERLAGEVTSDEFTPEERRYCTPAAAFP